ncbi:hypothetical protein Tco_1152359 [Tanacetum coccineum]
MVAFLKKPNESVGFTEVVDFLKGTSFRYALTHNPTIYDSLVKQFWQTATVKTLANGTQQLVASIDSKEYTITEAFGQLWIKVKAQHNQLNPITHLLIQYHPHPIPPHQSPPHSPLPHSPPQSPPHFSPHRSYETPLPEELKDTKQTLGNVVLKLVKKVKTLETTLKRKSKKVLISESEGEELEDQGLKFQDINDDHLVSLVRESMKEKSTDFVTPIKASGEAQEEEISPTILEAAKTLSKVASQGVSKEKSTDKGKRYMRRARSIAKKIDIGLDAEEEINTGREEINTGIEEVSTGSTKVNSGTASKRGQREGKAPMFYIEENWDTIRAKLEANAELSKDLLGQDLPEQDFAKRMVDMNQGTWKLSKLKKLKFEEIEEEFDNKGRSASKKNRKKKPRKGINVDKSAQEDSETDKEESVKAMNPTPLDIQSDSVQMEDISQGQRSVYQIIRANGADTVYMSFGAMIKDFTREDLIELYRLVMQKYGTNRPEDAYDRVLWSDLQDYVYDPPLIEDAIWSLPLQQKMVSWRYYDKCEVHCLTLEACTIYMLADRKYPLSKEACQVMLKMKLLDGKMNEVCYKLLKMIEK